MSQQTERLKQQVGGQGQGEGEGEITARAFPGKGPTRRARGWWSGLACAAKGLWLILQNAGIAWSRRSSSAPRRTCTCRLRRVPLLVARCPPQILREHQERRVATASALGLGAGAGMHPSGSAPSLARLQQVGGVTWLAACPAVWLVLKSGAGWPTGDGDCSTWGAWSSGTWLAACCRCVGGAHDSP